MRERIYKTSLFALILACATIMPADAAVKAKNSNRSYASGYQQVNAMRYQQEYMNATESYATTASATANLPVAVDDENLARSILNNESTVNVAELEACSMIYPNGVFKWAIPESGVRKNQSSQCVAVIELRDANTNAVLATTTVAAGDSMKCNIDYFPESGFNMAALSNIELPADAAPTEEDVKAVMNAEQKQNAGFKIAAGAIIAGVAGNLLAPKEAGAKQGKIPLGTGKTQLRDTAIGAVAGAGIMAASTYSGKVAGDTIKSTAVNAASGMLVGNMLSGANSGDSVVATTKCKTEAGELDCIVGNLEEIAEGTWSEDDKIYITSGVNAPIYSCEEENGELKDCQTESNLRLIDIKVANLDTQGGALLLTDVLSHKSGSDEKAARYEENKNGTSAGSKTFTECSTSGCADTMYYKIVDAKKTTGRKRAYAVFVNGALPKKAFGLQTEDIDFTKANIYYRNPDGSVGDKIADGTDDKHHFTASSRDADSSGLIDLSNEARAKATIAGTAAGGALGGFAGYQGAKDEVTERLLAAQREYEDSLTNVVCMTGGRYLSPYNSYVEIPDVKKAE